jgi:aspartate ammonia-lyase
MLIVALAETKAAATLANRDLGVLEPELADAIVAAARDVARGSHHDEFQLAIVQGGGGTSTHMNMNEVLANLANERLGQTRGRYAPVHPHDHVNRSQSTNDVVPTATGIAVYRATLAAAKGLDRLCQELLRQAEAYAGVSRLGRTCLQDALPIPVSAVHRAQAHAIAEAASALDERATKLLAVPLGVTAVGTGFGASNGYRELALAYLREETGLAVRHADDSFDALASLEKYALLADAVASTGRVVGRVAADLRLLSSGPVGGIGELGLPALQPGSSMMPGKVNPVLPELVMQVSYQLSGAAHVVHLASAAGELELAAMGPVVTSELLRGLGRLGRVAALFADLCIAGLRWHIDRIDANLAGSLEAAVDRAELVGYERATPLMANDGATGQARLEESSTPAVTSTAPSAST